MVESASALVTGMAAVSAFGPGVERLVAAALAGTPAFAPIGRFDVTDRRVTVAATMPGSPNLRAELTRVVAEACTAAGLTASECADAPLLLAVHGGDPDVVDSSPDAFAGDIATACGLAAAVRAYPSACVAASTAVADAAAMVTLGHAERVIVAAGYLVDPHQFALFDAGRAMARDGRVRPFSERRTGLLLGDGVAAIVIESRAAARRRDAPVDARLAGWGRAGDSYHVCQPHPEGIGLARAIVAALTRGRVDPGAVGYVNAHGSGTTRSDTAEAAALARALGRRARDVPVSSTKSVHGQALEASGLLELIVTVRALQDGMLPVNAGYLGADPDCPLNLIVDGPREARPAYALSLNSAFGGSNTALLVGTP
jgi:3-oxoacyl-(acyl-carrier-protein) synthase